MILNLRSTQQSAYNGSLHSKQYRYSSTEEAVVTKYASMGELLSALCVPTISSRER